MAKKLEEIKEEECPYELPDGWKWERLGNVTKRIKRGKSPKYTEKSNVLVFAQKCNQKSGEISLEKALFLDLEKLSKYKDDDFLYRKDVVVNSTGTGTLGRVGFFDIPLIYDCDRIVPDSHVTVIRANEIILSECLYYYLKSKQTLLESLGEGSTNQKELKVATLENLLLPLPPKETQQKIVDIIDSLFAKLDIAQEKVEQVLAESENRRSAILHNAFSGKLTEKWRKENNVSFDSWCIDKLKNFDIEIIDGDRGKNYPKKEEFSNKGECVFLNAKNVTKKGFSFSEVQFISKEKDDLLRKGKLVRGDIVLTTRGTIGNIALYDDVIPYNNMRINSGMVIYRCGDTLYKPFLINLYRSKYIIDQINEMQTGSAQSQLPIKIMNELELCLPTLLEQKEIVRLLDKFLSVEDKVKSTCQSTLEAIATMRKSILAKAFRGELCS